MIVDIRNEDCQDTIQSLESHSVDVILTSPFYNTNRPIIIKPRVGHAPEGRYDIHLDNMTSSEYIDFTNRLFDGFDRILKQNGVVIYNINYGSENTTDMFLVISDLIYNSNFTIADVICWKKKSAIPNNVSPNKLTRIWEFVFVLCRKNEFNTFHMNKKVVSTMPSGQKVFENLFNFVETPNNDGNCNLNKATYSSDLCEWLLSLYAPKNATIYDPFNGTGTTGVAAKRLGMAKYIGSEISEAQVKFSLDRINGATVYRPQTSDVYTFDEIWEE